MTSFSTTDFFSLSTVKKWCFTHLLFILHLDQAILKRKKMHIVWYESRQVITLASSKSVWSFKVFYALHLLPFKIHDWFTFDVMSPIVIKSIFFTCRLFLFVQTTKTWNSFMEQNIFSWTFLGEKDERKLWIEVWILKS